MTSTTDNYPAEIGTAIAMSPIDSRGLAAVTDNRNGAKRGGIDNTPAIPFNVGR